MDHVSCSNWPWGTKDRLRHKRLPLGELRTSLQEKSVPLLGSGHCSQEASQTGKSGDLGFTFKSAEEHEGYGAATSRQD